ncbi:MAG: hypothetical protein WBO32_05420, partial [Cyclobacteriaceae bacterium]
MRDPEEYFHYRREGEHHVYEWFDSTRVIIIGLLSFALAATFFVKTFIDKTMYIHVYVIFCIAAITVVIFFWIYDRFRITINKEEIFVARGLLVYFGSAKGIQYLRKDISTFYKVSPWDYSDNHFVFDTTIIYAFLNNRKRIRITNQLAEEYGKYMVEEIKIFMPFGDRP